MKRLLAFGAVLCAVTLSGSRSTFARKWGRAYLRENGVAEFAAPVRLMNVVLKGEFQFVHDEEKMAAGKDCTYVYEMVAGKPVKLVLSFHCRPVPRWNVEKFTIRGWFVGTDAELYEVQEFQFAGSQ